MGLLVEGQRRDVWYDTKSTHGRFVRKDAAFRNWISPTAREYCRDGRKLSENSSPWLRIFTPFSPIPSAETFIRHLTTN